MCPLLQGQVRTWSAVVLLLRPALEWLSLPALDHHYICVCLAAVIKPGQCELITNKLKLECYSLRPSIVLSWQSQLMATNKQSARKMTIKFRVFPSLSLLYSCQMHNISEAWKRPQGLADMNQICKIALITSHHCDNTRTFTTRSCNTNQANYISHFEIIITNHCSIII